MTTETGAPAITVAELQARIDRIPFNKWLGLTLVEFTPNGVRLTTRWRDEMTGVPELPAIHGGILASLIDSGGSYAIARGLGRAVPTVDLRIDYHAAAAPGDLTILGELIHLGRTVSTAETKIHSASGKLLASGRGVYFTAPARYEVKLPADGNGTQ